MSNRIFNLLGASYVGKAPERILQERVADRAQYKAQLSALGYPKAKNKATASVLDYYQENEKEINRLCEQYAMHAPQDVLPPDPTEEQKTAYIQGERKKLEAARDAAAKALEDFSKQG